MRTLVRPSSRSLSAKVSGSDFFMERRSFDLCQGDLVGHGELLFFFNLFQGIFNDGIVFQDFEVSLTLSGRGGRTGASFGNGPDM